MVFEIEAPLLAVCLLSLAEEDRTAFLTAFARNARVHRKGASSVDAHTMLS